MHSRLFFHLTAKQRKSYKKNSLNLTDSQVVDGMNYLEFDGVFTCSKQKEYSLKEGYRKISFANQNNSTMIFEKNELIIIEVKRSYSLLFLTFFIDTVLGLYDNFKKYHKDFHLIFFYDTQVDQLNPIDYEFLKYLHGGSEPTLLWTTLDNEAKEKKRLTHITKRFLI